MKSSSAPIKAYLETLNAFTNKLTKISTDLAAAQGDAEKFERAVARSEESTDYSDAAVEKATAASNRLAICQRAISKLEERLAEAMEERRTIIAQGGGLAVAALKPIVANCEETIVCQLALFSADRASALRLARETDVFRQAYGSLCRYAQLDSSTVSWHNPAANLRLLAEIRAVLVEASKDGGDLMQFLSFRPAPAVGPATAEPAATEGAAAS